MFPCRLQKYLDRFTEKMLKRRRLHRRCFRALMMELELFAITSQHGIEVVKHADSLYWG